MRIENHPILTFEKKDVITFYFNGKEVKGYKGDTIASALHALGIKKLSESIHLKRPRGFYCAIGNCASCNMTVNDIPNVRTCITPLEEGMDVRLQEGKGAVKMRQVPFVIVGAGPAGLRAAKSLLEAGASVLIIDRSPKVGGQLIKQTHMFFGSEKQHASKRGIDILDLMLQDVLAYDNVEMMMNTTVVGLYKDKVISCLTGDTYFKIQADAIIIAAGASEKALPFENNDLPGVYAAGAVQTLMNVYGVKPGDRVLMVGSGNIGLIVSYQLMQAGVEVVKLVEAASSIGGYLVHASKIKRLGVDILTNTSIKRAIGKESVEAAEIWQLDDTWQGIPGTEEIIEVDTICMAVGLAPLTELLQQIGAKVKYVRELGGNVAVIDEHYETTIDNVYACGDVAGIEEASSAMIAGEIAGIEAAVKQGYKIPSHEIKLQTLRHELTQLRNGPHGAKVRAGLAKLGVEL